ncbi:MAG: hypothetical protein RLP09_27140 [Sandaracinaceae bacterium]
MQEAQFETPVGEDRAVRWEEGTLLWPAPGQGCRCLDVAREGFPPLTLLTLVGRYERPSRHEKRLHLAHVRVFRTPRDRASEALRRWEHARRFALDAASVREELERYLRAIVDDLGPEATALRGRVALAEGRLDEVEVAARRLLGVHDLKHEEEEALASMFRALVDAGRDPTPTAEARDALVRRIWQAFEHSSGPQTELHHAWSFWIPALSWETHRTLRERVPHPWFFGGPALEPDYDALAPFVHARFEALADEAERAQLARIRAMDDAGRRAWLAGAQDRDDRRRGRAYDDMVQRWDGGRDGLDSPPDDVDVTWDEEIRSLPAQLCAFELGRREGEDLLVSSPARVGAHLAERYRERRPAARRSFVLALDAAAVLSRLAPELAGEVVEVVFASVETTRSRVLVRLREGSLALVAPEGPFGAWEVERGDEASLVAGFEPSDRPLVAMALKREALTEPVRSPRSFLVVGTRARSEGAASERWVVHARYGRGLVVGSTPGPRGPKLLIEFEGVGRKQLLHSFVEDE